MSGFVALVGAGPGDPDLITVRGLRYIQQADVLVHDRLVSRDLLAHAHPGAEIIYVGKSPGNHLLSQTQINNLIIERASRTAFVVRLKGGDPFVFGRGGEEALALIEASIAFEVVPGVSSALAGPAAIGIPVSHRGVASTFAVATAHDASEGKGPDWSALARIDTVVLLMGVERLEHAARALIAAGKPASTPAAVVQDATLATQRAVVAPLWGIAAAAHRAGLKPPAVTVIGDVVTLADTLAAVRGGSAMLAAEL